jgi:hypothetical protein
MAMAETPAKKMKNQEEGGSGKRKDGKDQREQIVFHLPAAARATDKSRDWLGSQLSVGMTVPVLLRQHGLCRAAGGERT